MLRPDIPTTAAVAAACYILGAIVLPPTMANELKTKLDAVQQDLDKVRERRADIDRAAKKADFELKEIKRKGVSLARAMHRHSTDADTLETRLAELQHQEGLKTARLVSRRAQLASTLAALQRLARMPAVTLIAIPQPTDKTIRSAILLRAAVPELQRDATALGEDLRTLSALRERIDLDRKALSTSLKRLESERRKLAALTADKLTLLKSMLSADRLAAQKTARLSAQAGSLRELLDRLSAPPQKPALRLPDVQPAPLQMPEPKLALRRPAPKPRPASPVTIARGDMPAPGKIVTAFGQKMPNGTQSKGIFIHTRPSAAVVAPMAGRVVFAGRFRGYGNLVILELSDRGHALISGMSGISAQVGDELLVGEPLGEMTPSTNAAPELYFELRKRGRPINPLPSDTARTSKVKG